MLKCGLLGKKLGHSYSPEIHALLSDYEYRLYEKNENELADFIRNGSWSGLNVTVPYKKRVVDLLDQLSDDAREAGSVNSIIRKSDGILFGDNTDIYGFLELIRCSGKNIKGKKAVILGNGGAAGAVKVALEKSGAIPIIVSRKGQYNYNNIYEQNDAEIIINATPVGMYPNNGEAVVDLGDFPFCRCVIDLIYNPARTSLLLQAEALGIPVYNGLSMLVAQAEKSSALFSGRTVDCTKIETITKKLKYRMQNIILIGMPGCGKTSIAEKLSEITNREYIDSDYEIKKQFGYSAEEIILMNGEKEFREKESQIIEKIGKESGKIISTGGGSVLVSENYGFLHQNGVIVWIQRDFALLQTDNRPISKKNNLQDIYNIREKLYERFADVTVKNDSSLEDVARKIIKEVKKYEDTGC